MYKAIEFDYPIVSKFNLAIINRVKEFDRYNGKIIETTVRYFAAVCYDFFDHKWSVRLSTLYTTIYYL